MARKVSFLARKFLHCLGGLFLLHSSTFVHLIFPKQQNHVGIENGQSPF